ncbi:MAG: dihydroorotase [Planctomycetota bacterium]
MNLLVRGGTLVTHEGAAEGDLLIREGRIQAPGALAEGCEILDAGGMLVLPGVIDTQVHFREPGATHKEDLESGSLAAVAGGVTSFFEMPNTRPSTTSPERLADKLERARDRAWSDHAFFLGATRENADRLGEWEQLEGCAGVKVFMGSSTGSLLVDDDETLDRVFRSGERRVAVHSEDETRLRARYAKVKPGSPVSIHPEVRDVEAALRSTRRLLDLAEKTGRRVHLLHVSTAEEVELLRERDLGDLVTGEATPNHLFLHAPECYERHGSLVQMNPPVRDRRHMEAIREGLATGVLSCVGSDHAPHTLEEKSLPYPESPSGIPGVQTTLPLLLTAVGAGWLRIEDVVRITSRAPARIYGIEGKGGFEPGMDGDAVVVDPQVRAELPEEWLRSRAGFSPYVGTPLAGWPVATILRGRIVHRDHATRGAAGGRPVRF